MLRLVLAGSGLYLLIKLGVLLTARFWALFWAHDAAQCDTHLRASLAERGPRTVYTEEAVDYPDESGLWQ